MNFCPQCGAKTAHPDDKFCMNCGFAMPVVAAPLAEPAPPPAVAGENFAAPTGHYADAGVAPKPPMPVETPVQAGYAPPIYETGSQPLFKAAVGSADDGNLFGTPVETAPVADVVFRHPPVPADQTMPAAQSEDLLHLLEETQKTQHEPAPDILPYEAPAAQPPEAALGFFAETPAAQPPEAAPDLFAETPAAQPPEAAPSLFAETPAAQPPEAAPGFFAEAPAAQPPEAAPGFFAEAPAAQPPEAAPGFFAEAPAAQPRSAYSQAPQPNKGHPAPAPQQRQPKAPPHQQTIRQPQQVAPQVYPQQAAGNLFSEDPQRAFADAAQDTAPPQPYGGTPGQTFDAPARRRKDEKASGKKSRRDSSADAGGYEDGYEEPRRSRRKTPPPVRLPDPEPQPRRRSLLGNIFMFFFVVVLIAALVGAATVGMLYFNNRPEKVVDDFVAAIAAGDAKAVEELVKIDGAEVSDEGWEAFMAAFKKQTDLNVLKAQLKMQADKPDKEAVGTYPAVTIESRPFILFIEKYSITIKGVDLLAPGAAEGSTIRLGSTDYFGTGTSDGLLVTGLMPGKYECRLAAPGVSAGDVQPTEIVIFEVDEPNVLGLGETRADLTIENVVGEIRAVYVNDIPVEDRPDTEVLHLSGLTLGSAIRVETKLDGKDMEATVVFNDPATTTLRMENYTERGGGEENSKPESKPEEDSEALITAKKLSEDDINSILSTFYGSYLGCINDQKIDGLKMATDDCKTAMGKRMEHPANKSNKFEFGSAACDGGTIKPTDKDGVPTVSVSAKFKYRFKPREEEKDWEDDSNKQNVELVHKDGKWLVNKMEFVE